MTLATSPSRQAPSSFAVRYREPVVFIVVVLALSVLVGGLWVWLSPTVTATVTAPGEAQFGEGSAANLFGGVATFAFLSFGLGVVLALGSWFGLRSMRGVPGLLLTTVIAIVSSGLAMDIGTRIAKAVRPALDENVPGDYELTARLWFDSDVSPPWLLLVCAPTTAILVYLLCVLAAKNPTLRPDTPTPDWSFQATAAVNSTAVDSAGNSEWRPQGGEFVGHPQAGVGEGVQAGRSPAGPTGASDGAGGHDHPAPRQDP
ncbi:hypothetical protein MP11Mi_28940 [Gordonia sp. MP11Mi]|uniref:DUF2567 domain-containing protein n=1 Tax=Gordonia sp. MP11Mi TaxID=3022769 RepID=A0AA97CXM8_9ACTN